MRWTEQEQVAATKAYTDLLREYAEKNDAWRNSVLSGSTSPVGQAAVEDVVRRLRQNISNLQANSEVIMSNDSVMESLSQLAAQVADEKETLKRLRSEAVTRENQSDSVNPKVRGSPYTNMLGLHRTFRSSTWYAILIASIVFGLLALVAFGTFVYGIISSGSLMPEGYVHAGGRRSTTGF